MPKTYLNKTDRKPECPNCGAIDYQGELKECPHCGTMKCEHCDMGDDVPCLSCEDNGEAFA